MRERYSDRDRDFDRNTGSVSNAVMSASDYAVIDSDDYDR